MEQIRNIAANEDYHKAYILQLINFIDNKDEFAFFVENTGAKYCNKSRDFIEKKLFEDRFKNPNDIIKYFKIADVFGEFSFDTPFYLPEKYYFFTNEKQYKKDEYHLFPELFVSYQNSHETYEFPEDLIILTNNNLNRRIFSLSSGKIIFDSPNYFFDETNYEIQFFSKEIFGLITDDINNGKNLSLYKVIRLDYTVEEFKALDKELILNVCVTHPEIFRSAINIDLFHDDDFLIEAINKNKEVLIYIEDYIDESTFKILKKIVRGIEDDDEKLPF
jgi:hypothetical protein